MVMGGDSCSEGHGFESQRRILDGHYIFPHIFVVRKTKIYYHIADVLNKFWSCVVACMLS